MVSIQRIGSAIAGIPRDMVESLRMKPVQALVWFSCWSCWTLASMQYYALPFTTSNLAKALHVEQSKIQEANTTSMLSRSIGAIIFGISSDQVLYSSPLWNTGLPLTSITVWTQVAAHGESGLPGSFFTWHWLHPYLRAAHWLALSVRLVHTHAMISGLTFIDITQESRTVAHTVSSWLWYSRQYLVGLVGWWPDLRSKGSPQAISLHQAYIWR